MKTYKGSVLILVMIFLALISSLACILCEHELLEERMQHNYIVTWQNLENVTIQVKNE